MVQNALLEIITVADDSYKNAKTNITKKKHIPSRKKPKTRMKIIRKKQ